MANMRMKLIDVPIGYYAHYTEVAHEIGTSLALIRRCQNDIETYERGNFQYFLRYINSKSPFDVMIPYQAYTLLRDDLAKGKSSEYCDIYEYIYGKDTIRVYSYLNYDVEAIGEVNNKEWQEAFKKYT